MAISKIFRYALVSFIIGIGLRSFFIIPIVMVWSACVLAMIAFAYAWRKNKNNAAAAAFFIVMCAAGIARFTYAQQHVPDMTLFSHKRIEVAGVIREEPIMTETSQRLIVEVTELQAQIVHVPVRIAIQLRKYPAYRKGDIMRLEGIFEASAYDGKTSGMLFSTQTEKTGEEKASIFFSWMEPSRRAFDAHVDAALPEPHAGFMKGLLLGERATLPADLLEQFKITGTSHIIALSGYNITIVGTFLVEILLMLTVPFWMTFWIASGSIILFVLIAGAQASLVRAAIMGILVLVAAREGRTYHMTNALVCAAAIMLVLNPYLLRFDVGFELSFLATLGLVYLTLPVDRVFTFLWYRTRVAWNKKQIYKEKENRIAHAVKKIMTETIAAQLAVLPLLVYLFGGVSVIAPVSNLFVLAAVPAAMGLGFATGMAGFFFAPLSIMLGWCAWIFLEYELIVIRAFSKIPFSFIHVSSAGLIVVLVIYAVVFFMQKRKKEVMEF